MAVISSTLVLLILSCTISAFSPRSQPAMWGRYIDRMCTTCISSRARGVLPKVEYLFLCIDYQRTNLHCVSSNTFLSLNDQNITDQDKPCGFIQLSNRFGHYQLDITWAITVNQQFYMNLTVLEFVLSMPYGQCDLNQGSERLVIASKKDAVSKNHLSFCGERSPFSVLWKSSDAVVVYKSVLASTEAGRFLIQYQVCEKNVIIPKTQTVDHTALLEPPTPMRLRIGVKEHFQMGKDMMFYNIHLLGNRMKVLDLGLVMDSISKDSIIVHAFDGPGHAEMHRHVDEEYLVEGHWIYFLTFQGYLRIECDIEICGKLLIQYQWQIATQFAINFLFQDSVNINNIGRHCLVGNIWYCLYTLKMTNAQENVQIILNHVRFVGPNYLGDFSEHHDCLLAGVTILDNYRLGLSGDLYQYIGDMPKEIAIDHLLPEITICYQVPFVDGDDPSQTAYRLPLTKMVSTGSVMHLLVYAYGAYVDLKKSIIELTISPTACTGLVLSCDSIPSDGFLEIGSVDYVPPKAKLKELICPFGNMLTAMINVGRFKTNIEICTQNDTGLTTVSVVPHLIPSADFGRCLIVQINPHATAVNKNCSLFERDPISHKPLKYDIYFQEPRSLHCAREESSPESYYLKVKGMKDTLNSSSNVLQPDKNKYSGEFVNMLMDVMAACIKLEVSTTLVCVQPQIQDDLPTTILAGKELKQSHIVVPCEHYSISVGQNNYTHLVYGAPQQYMIEMQYIIQEAVKMDSLLTMMMNWEIGKAAVISSFMLNEECPLDCRLYKVQIAYWSAVTLETILLEWQIFINSNTYEIKVFDLPVSETLIYITSLGICENQRCILDVDLKFTDNKTIPFPKAIDLVKHPITFAEYVLYWTSQEYTWYEAEDVCQQAGDMHLASITNEEEYILVQGILAGDTFVNSFQVAEGILTPCRLGTPLCAIYIGLQVHGSKFAWRDGRSHGFISLQGNCLESITRRRKADGNDLQLTILPQESDTTCTVLTGSPGPTDMVFVNVSCNQKLKVSGILCIRGGQTLQQSQPHYRLTHFKRKSDSSLIWNSTVRYLNVAMLHAAVSVFTEITKMVSARNVQGMLAEETYVSLLDNFKKSVPWVWEESFIPCNQTSVLCKIFHGYSSSSGEIHKLTQEIMVPDGNKSPHIGSVYLSYDSIVSSAYCPQLTFAAEKGCVYLVDKPTIKNMVFKENLDHTCATHLSGSRVYEVSVSESHKYILRILTDRRPALSIDNNGTISVILSDENEVQFYPNFVNGSEVRFILCSVDPLPPRCPVRHSRCNNGCISDLFVCDGKADCDDGEDETQCHNLCEALGLTTSVMYCLKECHPENCTCSDLYFQCLSGGCLHSSKLCDGKSDCKDMSDEKICTKYFYKSNTEGHSVKTGDLLPAHSSSLNKSKCKNMLTTLENDPATHCSALNHLHCLIGHPACYPMDKRCVYDHTEGEELKYCRTGGHLHGCQNVNCSGSFKCYKSYCVPAHKVCNGELDCPYGDDERLCPVKQCQHMLHCGNICVHPIDICDGTANCMDGEDELLCDLPECPHDCTCNGHAIRCASATMFDASLKPVRIMSFKYSQNVVLTSSTLAYLVDLLFLDLTYCNIAILPEMTIFQTQNALIKLDLSHNVIMHLVAGSLDGLSNLQELDLSWNPLNRLDQHVLDGLVNLQILSLSHCELNSIPPVNLLDTHALDIVDLSHAKILDIGFCAMKANVLILSGTSIRVTGITTDHCWQNITRIVSDQPHLCCLRFFADKCTSKGLGNKAICQPMFWHQILVVYSLLLSAVIVACNGCVLVHKAFIHDVDTPLISNLAFSDTLVVIPVVLFTHWHLSHGTSIAFYEPFLASHVWCNISGYVLTGIMHLSTWFSLFVSLVKYFGIVHMKHVLKDYKLQFYVVIVCAWVGFASIGVLLGFNNIETPTTFVDCLFGHQQSIRRQFLLFYSVTNTAITIVNACLYSSILRVIWATHRERRTIGQKHGRDTYVSSVARLIAINVCSSIAVLSQAILFAGVFFEIDVSTQSMVSCIIILFPLQPMCNPFLYSLSTRRFKTAVNSLFCNR